jgi:hypothetical protein
MDGVRDLPDVSLFAGNGVWGSAYLFCESDATSDGTCNPTSSTDTQFLASGGTSFASPNFAGLVALINQKTNSIQGNVDYDLYNLAAKQYGGSNNTACDSSTVGNGSSCMFYDISQGSNAVPCQAGSTDCTITGPSSDFLGVLPGWNAGVGYDTAVGLGSVNAYNLVNAWSTASASLISTGTTLSLDSTSVPYGVPVTGKITVTGGASGAASPSGDTSLISASGKIGVGFGPFTLSNGEATLSGIGVVAGKYPVAAHYAGDSNFAESTSPATTLTVTQASTNTSLTASRSSFTFGESDTFAVTVATTSKGLSPTGSVTFTNTTTGARLGVIAIQPQTDADGNAVAVSSIPITGKNVNQGNNTITAAYSGDSNYVASTATAVTVNYTPPFTLSLGQSSITVTSGKTATATISLVASSGPLPSTVVLSCPNAPAGISCLFSPASFAAGSSNATSTLTINGSFPPASAAIRRGSNGRVSMLKTTGGLAASVALALLIVPSRRRRSALGLFVLLFGVALLSNGCGGGSSKNVNKSPVASTTTLQSTPTSGVQGTNFTFSATIAGAGSSSTPTGTVTFSDANSVLGTATITNGTASFATTSLALGAHMVVASYSGDNQFLPSASSSPVSADVQYQTTVNVTATDSLGNTTSIQLPVFIQ